MRFLLALLNCGFGLLVMGGSVFEIANLLDPTLVPSIQDVPIMRAHHTQPAVFRWTIASNLVTPWIGAGLVAVGVGLVRRRPWVLRVARVAALAATAIAVGGAIVCAIYLLPMALADAQSTDPARHADGLILLISIPSASFGMAALPLLSWALIARRTARATV